MDSAAPSLELPTASVQVYLQEFSAGCLFLATSPTNKPSMVGDTRDLPRAAEAIRKNRGLTIVRAWWTNNQRIAAGLAYDVTAAVGGSKTNRLLDVTPTEVADKVRYIALKQELILYDHQLVLERTRAAVQRIEDALHNGNQAGQLAKFNAAYQERRRRSIRFMTYEEARQRLFRELVKRLAVFGAYKVSINESVIRAVLGRDKREQQQEINDLSRYVS
jgi:hypothetical protein